MGRGSSSTAVHHSRLEDHRVEGPPSGEFESSLASPPIESLPTPAPHNEAPNSVRPMEVPKSALPELTPPSTEKPTDSALFKGRDRRIKPASYVMVPTPNEAAKDGGLWVAKPGNERMPFECDPRRRTHGTGSIVSTPAHNASQAPEIDEVLPRRIALSDGKRATREARAGTSQSNAASGNGGNGENDMVTATPSPQEDKRTTLVFKR
jgi:hypothetical protein